MVTAAMKLKGACSLGKNKQTNKKKTMTSVDTILKNREITLPTKVCLVKAMVFPVAMYGCESWIKRRLSTEELMLLNRGVGEDS